MTSTSWVTATPEDREKRLSAIADLEQQLQQRRSGANPGANNEATSSTGGKHFILLVSKNSSIWQQRSNQERAETMLSRFPHWILDGSNVGLVNKRNELFAISKEQGKYPQLFLVDNGVTTFIGGYELMEYYNEQGGLDELIKDSKSSKKKNIANAVKGLVKKTKVKKDKVSTKAGPSAGSEIPSNSMKSVSDMPGSAEKSVKPVSHGRLITERSDGNMPLAEEKSSHGERIHRNSKPKRSSSKTRTDDKKSSTRSRSRGKYKASEGEGGEADTKTRSRSSSRSTKRSSSVGRLRDSKKTLEMDDSSTKTRTRSSSRGRLRDSVKSSTPDEAITSSRRSRSRVARSRSRGRDGRGSSRSRSRARGENEDGSVKESDIKTAIEATRARSVSRSRRSTRTSLKTMDASEHSTENKRDRKLRKSGIADSDPPASDSIKSPRRGTRVREQEGEQKRVSRRDTRSASPRRDRVRSASPGTYRGDVARKREAVKEFRERKNTKQGDDDGNVRRRKSSSFGLAVPDSPRRALGGSIHGVEKRVLGGSSHGAGKSFDNDESLHELVKRLRDKEKDRNGEIEEDQRTVELPSVQW